ncbi:MAG: Ig domain-containing protein, partial [Ruminococcus sp.]|nr:Ig domain-containing protein [Ruminococcus sp.]
VGVGTCTITVTSSNNRNVSAKITVNVTGNTSSQITGITLSKYAMNLTVGQRDISWVTMTPTTAPETAKGEIWTSSNTAVATVDGYGNVTAVGVGTCTITVTSSNNRNVSANITVNVTGNSTSSVITGITLSKTTMNLTVGQKDISWVTMTPTTAPESLKGEIWTSSNTAVATVDGYGNVTAVGVGTCTITVTSSNNRNVSAKITVNVTGNTSSQITGITLSKYTMNLTVGQKDISWVTMTPTTAPESLKGEIWTSSNTAVAIVDGYGNVTAVGAGTCTITVTSSNNRNVSAKITVNVSR